MKNKILKIKKVISDIDYQLRPEDIIAPKEAVKIVKNWAETNIGSGRIASIRPIKKAVECVIVFNQADLVQMMDQ